MVVQSLRTHALRFYAASVERQNDKVLRNEYKGSPKETRVTNSGLVSFDEQRQNQLTIGSDPNLGFCSCPHAISLY